MRVERECREDGKSVGGEVGCRDLLGWRFVEEEEELLCVPDAHADALGQVCSFEAAV